MTLSMRQRPHKKDRYRRRGWASVLGVAALLGSFLYGADAINAPTAQAQDNGASRTPPMGWSSWSSVRNNPTEAKIKAQAQAMHDSGLMDVGYKYINLDDYYIKNPGTTVDQYGRWVVDTGKFPDGMKNLGDFIHGLGEKFGMYVTPGIPKAAYDQNTPIEGTSYHARDIVSSTSTFESNYGGFGNVMYFIDYNKNPTAAQAFVNSWANLFASYGVDYIKIDGVHTSDQNDVIAWSKALNQTGRTIHLGLSNTLDINNIKTWQQYSNSWRTGGDIECYCSTLTTWSNVGPRWANLAQWGQYAGPGGWNDPDSIEVGNGDHTGLTVNERQSVITLWAITRSVMMLGSDLTNLDAGDLNMLKNAEVTNVNQTDSVVASQISNNNDLQVWATRQKNPDGSYTVALFNRSDRAGNETVTANFSDLGFSGSATVRNLWGKSNETLTNSVSRSLAPHESALFKVTPSDSSTPVGGNLTSSLSGRCADDPNSTLVNGTQLVVWDCNGGANQKITYSSSAKALKVLGKCFDAHGGATTAGTHVEIYDCNGGTNQQWNVNSDGTITGVQSGLCLDVTGTTNPNGAGLELWNCNGGANQKWTLGAGVKVA